MIASLIMMPFGLHVEAPRVDDAAPRKKLPFKKCGGAMAAALASVDFA